MFLPVLLWVFLCFVGIFLKLLLFHFSQWHLKANNDQMSFVFSIMWLVCKQTHQRNVILSVIVSWPAFQKCLHLCYKKKNQPWLPCLYIHVRAWKCIRRVELTDLHRVWENGALKLEPGCYCFCLLLCILTREMLLLSDGTSLPKSRSEF